MTPEQIAEVRLQLVAFAGQMLGDLARSDQRAAGKLYVRLAADRRPAQVDGGDGGAARDGSSAAAAVHHLLGLGLASLS